MSQKNGGRDPEAYERIFIKQGDRPVELVMPPMDKEAKLDQMRCARYLLDMLIKYGPAIQAEKETVDEVGEKK